MLHFARELVTGGIFLLMLVLTPAAAFASCPGCTTPSKAMARLGRYNVNPQLSRLTLNMALSFPRGGASAVMISPSSILSQLADWKSSPTSLFNTSLVALALATTIAKILQRVTSSSSSTEKGASSSSTPDSVKSLRRRFLAVFWMLRCSDWLQGPYFYEVYASKVINGVQASIGLVSRLFLTGFASTALFGPSVGRAADQYGRKKATLAFSAIYALGALSTKSPLLMILFAGRILSGIGTSLLFSAPESWLVGESQKGGDDPDGKYLGETFGLAYAGDSIVAIVAGQIAALAASKRGPTGPFEVSTAFLLLGGLLAAATWGENAASRSDSNAGEKPSISEAVKVIQDDPKIMLVGAVQSLFEAAMYIFVLQWPPAMSSAIKTMFGDVAKSTPYGTIFSCFMASCLLGSTLFGQLVKVGVPTETFTAAMLSVAALAMSGATWMVSSTSQNVLWGFMASFFVFEACVGMYFPGIGTLRSKYIPDSHRSVIMNLFGIPLNALVVSVFLTLDKLGLQGALTISSGALGLAALCMLQLQRIVGKKKVGKSIA